MSTDRVARPEHRSMMSQRLLVSALLVATVVATVGADVAPYAGQDSRDVKALDPERIEGLRAGAGLGYAKAAELNGWPGPLHVLELKDRLALTIEQTAAVGDIRAAMLESARSLGERLIDAEAELDRLFAEEDPDADRIARETADIASIEAALRAVHLQAHLETKPLLSRHQRMIYQEARGYAGASDHSVRELPGGHEADQGSAHGSEHHGH